MTTNRKHAQKNLEALAYQVEQQGQGENPVLNAAAQALREAGQYRHKCAVLGRDKKRLVKALRNLSPAFGEGMRSGLLKPEWVESAVTLLRDLGEEA